MKKELTTFALLAGTFVACFHLPVGQPRFDGAVQEALALTQWYAREHVILCLLPAFWIAGAIGAFVSQQSVMRYLGPGAPKVASYGVASVSGSILAVCSCTVLPLFSGIYRRGAGLGPAAAFLYSGPAINVLAVILTAKVLGIQPGAARVWRAAGTPRHVATFFAGIVTALVLERGCPFGCGLRPRRATIDPDRAGWRRFQKSRSGHLASGISDPAQSSGVPIGPELIGLKIRDFRCPILDFGFPQAFGGGRRGGRNAGWG